MPKLAYTIPRLRALRRKLGLTLDDLARLSGVPKSRLSCIERGATINAARYSAIMLALADVDHDSDQRGEHHSVGLARRLLERAVASGVAEARP